MQLYEANQQWRSRPADERFSTLSDLSAAVNARRARMAQADVQMEVLKAVVSADNAVQLSGPNGRPAYMSHWSFGQLASRVSAPAEYLRRLPADLAVANLNHSIQSADRDGLRVLVERGEDSRMVRAVTSQSYARIWDADVVAACQRIVERSGDRFFNPKDWSGNPSGLYASDHDVFMFMIDGGSMVDGGGERDQLHRGFFMWNSETGARTFGLMSFLFRVACGNHIVWDAQDVNKWVLRHAGRAVERFDRDVMPALQEYCNASSAPVSERVRKAKAFALPFDGSKDADGLVRWGRGQGFSRPEIEDAFDAATKEEGQCASLWDFVNGLTASARDLSFVDARVDLESRAGKLLALVA